ncbi:MAG: hypothetical protein K8T25_10950 [Planctomycetia bacterium]|nr:hypothetical protein [Planctomycetia bacterium]
MNYDAEAKRIANYVRGQRVEQHRGVIPLEKPGVSVVFGNDDYAKDMRTREQVRLLFQDAYETRVDILGFAVDDEDGAAWSVVVRCDDLDWLKARLHDAFFQSHGLYSSNATVQDAVVE